MTPVEAAMFLRLDETGHSPESTRRTLNYWRDRGEFRATKYARHVWYLKNELEKFLGNVAMIKDWAQGEFEPDRCFTPEEQIGYAASIGIGPFSN